MDINLHKLTNSSWGGLDHMTMEDDHILHNHQLPLDSIWHNNYPLLQTHEEYVPPPSSSSQLQVPPPIITGVLFGGDDDHDPMGKNQMLGDDGHEEEEAEEEELGAMKEMMYKIASMQPVDIDPATIRKPKRRNVRISEDPQSVAARHRRERISEKIRILQRLVPGGTKMDTASMLDEAIRYVKFLKRQIRQLQQSNHHHHHPPCIGGVTTTGGLLATHQDWTWLPITSNKTLASSEDPVGFTLGGSGGGGGETFML